MGKIFVDSREKAPALKAIADEIKLLEYKGDNGEAFSYDIHVETDAGETYRYERKAMADLISTFKKRDGTLERQTAATDGIIVEWDEGALAKAVLFNRIQAHEIPSIQKRLWRMSHSSRVIPTKGLGGPMGTIAFLIYMSGLTKPANSFEVTMRVKQIEPHMAILAQFPGINPFRKLPDGERLGDALWANVDRDRLAEAFGLGTWADLPGLGPGKVKNAYEFLGVSP